MHVAASRCASPLSPFSMDLSGRKSLPEGQLLTLTASCATVRVRSFAETTALYLCLRVALQCVTQGDMQSELLAFVTWQKREGMKLYLIFRLSLVSLRNDRFPLCIPHSQAESMPTSSVKEPTETTKHHCHTPVQWPRQNCK